MRIFPKLSHDDLVMLTKFTGGAAALVIVALFVSTAHLGTSQAAATYYTYPSGASIWINANPTGIYTGNSSLVTWSSTTTSPGSCTMTASPTYKPARTPLELFYTGKQMLNNIARAQLINVNNVLYSIGGSYIYTAPVSDPTKWTQSAKFFPVGLDYSQSAIIGDSIYTFGGYVNGNTYSKAIYAASTSDPTTWRLQSGGLPYDALYSNLVVTSDSLFMVGGYSNGLGGANNFIYTASTSNPTIWTKSTKTFPGVSGLWSASTVTVGDTIYMYGGLASNGGAYNLNIYSAPVSDPTTWTDTGKDIPGNGFYYQPQIQVVGSTIYIFGGNQSGNTVLTASTNDPTTVYNSNISLPESLGYGTSVLLNGTQIYIFNAGGGVNIYSNATNDPASWYDTNQYLPQSPGLAASQSAVLGNSIFLFGGDKDSGHGASVFTGAIFAASTSNPTYWVNTGWSLPDNIGYAQLAVVGNNMYLYGGEDNNSGSAGVLTSIYTASTSNPYKWINTNKTLPGKLSRSQVAIVGDNIYLFGGVTYSGCCSIVSTNVIYAASTSDPANMKLQSGKTLPTNVESGQLAVVGPNIYLYGGYNSGTELNTIYSASTSNPERWTNVTGKTLPQVTLRSSLAVIGDNIYLLGGVNNQQNSGDANPRSAGAVFQTIYAASTSKPTTWINTNKSLPNHVYDSEATVVGNAVYMFGGFYGNNGYDSADDLIYVTPATSSNVFASYAMAPWKTDGSINAGNTWPQITQDTTYTLSCLDNQSASGNVQQTVSVFPPPSLVLNAQTVNGTSTVSWNAQYVNSCTVSGTGISSQSTTSVQTGVQVYTGSTNNPTYTVTCTTAISSIKKTVISSNGWFYAVIKQLPSFGASWGQDAAQNLGNRVLNGWPASLACSYPPVDGSEDQCFNEAYGTVFGMFSAYQNSNFNNGSSVYYKAKNNTEGRYGTFGWDTAWKNSATTTVGNTTLYVPKSTPVTLEWACQEQQKDYFEDNCGLFGLSWCTSTFAGTQNTSGTLALFNQSSTTNMFGTTSTRGYMTVMSPSTFTPPNNTATYYIQCRRTANSSFGPIMTRTIKSVASPALPPTASIDADPTTVSNGYTMQVGDTAVITANYTYDTTNDAISPPPAATAIYGNDQKTTVPCANVVPYNASCDQVFDAQKAFTFSTTTPGTYTFYAAVQTAQYNNSNPMDTYASTQVTVIAPTASVGISSTTSDGVTIQDKLPETNAPTAPLNIRFSLSYAPLIDTPIVFTIRSAAGDATRTTDYALSGAGIVNPNGTTVTVPAGQTYVDVAVTPVADSIFEGDEPVVVTLAASNNYNIGSPSSATVTIVDSQSSVSLPPTTFTACAGSTVPDGTSCQFNVTPTRVRQGSAVKVMWNVTGLVVGANGNPSDSCTITASPAGSFSTQTWPQSGSTWVNTTGVSATVGQQTTFTLKCDSPDNSKHSVVPKSVTIVPGFQEI